MVDCDSRDHQGEVAGESFEWIVAVAVNGWRPWRCETRSVGYANGTPSMGVNVNEDVTLYLS